MSAQDLEKHHNAHQLKVMGKWSHKGIDVCIADGGPFHIHAPKNAEQAELQKDHPDGFYETCWTIMLDGKPWGESTLIFDRYHDHQKIGFEDKDKQRARTESAKRAAFDFVDAAKSKGLYG